MLPLGLVTTIRFETNPLEENHQSAFHLEDHHHSTSNQVQMRMLDDVDQAAPLKMRKLEVKPKKK